MNINEKNYKHIILLPSRDYFVLLDIGIYIYNINFTLKETIYNFTQKEIIGSDDYDYTTTELKLKNEYFISILNIKGLYLHC